MKKQFIILTIAAVGAWLFLRKKEEPAAAAPLWGGLKSGVIPGTVTTTATAPTVTAPTTPTPPPSGTVYSGTSDSGDTLAGTSGDSTGDNFVASVSFSKPKRSNTW